MELPLTALISDLHGNWPALTTAVADAQSRGAERFVCLGDVVGYGAKPRECLELVMRLIEPCAAPSNGTGALERGLCLQGNHEFALLNSATEFNPNARVAIEWTREQLSSGEDRQRNMTLWDFLGGLEPQQVEGEVMFAHGSPRDPVREYLLPRDSRDVEKMAANFKCMRASVCFVGHSHVPGIYYQDGTYYRPKGTEGPYDLALGERKKAIVNVGSVGQPRDGDRRLCYALFDGRTVTFVRLEYDVEGAQRDIRMVAALPGYLADRLAVGH